MFSTQSPVLRIVRQWAARLAEDRIDEGILVEISQSAHLVVSQRPKTCPGKGHVAVVEQRKILAVSVIFGIVRRPLVDKAPRPDGTNERQRANVVRVGNRGRHRERSTAGDAERRVLRESQMRGELRRVDVRSPANSVQR